MALNFNSDPYYDDFDPASNYYRILYKPGYAVQARELTQSQTILQDQITKFASNIFSQNTPISGGNVTTNLKCNYIKLQPVYNGNQIDVSLFNGQTVQDDTGTIIAKVISAIPSTGVNGDPATLIVSYLTGSQFPDGALINSPSINYTAQALATNSTGSSSVSSVAQGVFYIASNYVNSTGETITNGMFVQVNPQTVVLDKYDNSPSLRVGLNIVESIEDYTSDASLLDPAVGASNYQAPGADRYKISLNLETRPLTLGGDDGFIELVRINNGTIVFVNNTTQYSSINDYLAKRTFETNGDFIVNDFSLTPSTDSIDPSKYDLKIGKGVAYVHGYRLENQSDLTLVNDRAQTSSSVNNNINFIDYGQYFYVDTVNGLFDVTTEPKVDLHVVNNAGINSSNLTNYNSTKVGSGYIRGLVYDHAADVTGANTNSYVFKAYVTDIVANTLSSNAVVSGSSASAIKFYDTNGTFSSTANAYYNVTLTIVSGPSSGDIRRIVSYDQTTKTATVDTPFTTTLTANSVFALQFGTKDVDCIANTSSSISNNIVSFANINIEGKLNGNMLNDTFYENPDVPELIYNLGHSYVSSVANTQYQSTQVFRNKPFTGTPATVSVTLPGSSSVISFAGGTGNITGDALRQNYTVIVTSAADVANNGVLGSVLDISSPSSNTTVNIANNTLTIQSTKYQSNTNFKVSIIAKVNILNGDDKNYILKTKNLVYGNVASNVAVSGAIVTGTSNTFYDAPTGQVYFKNNDLVTPGQPQTLYFNDVKNIVKIVDSLDPTIDVSNSMLSSSVNDITNNFTFDNGQRDSIYGHASIRLKSGVPTPKGNLLVIFNYYSHANQSVDGYFSYESYRNSGELYGAIPTYTTKHGTVYNLRDSIDFRPCRKNGTATRVLEYSIDPSTSDSGIYIPQDLTNFQSNYGYYLGRKDKLVLSKDKNFQIIQGNPSLTPILPTEPDGSLVIANISHDPYTAYLPSESPVGKLPNLSIDKVRHRRWRMQDISDLERRVDNITTMSSTELNASNYSVVNSLGIPRVKNAIFVDDFTSYSIADTANPDFVANIDTLKNTFTAAQLVERYTLQANTAINSLNQLSANTMAQLGYIAHTTGKASRYYTLPYTTTPVVKQQLASRTLNINPFAVQVFQGILSLYPPMDNWIDNTIAPDLLIGNIDNLVQSTNGLNTTNVNNWQSIPGTQAPLANTATLISSYTLNQSYIKNIASHPYIDPQQIIVRAKNMKINTPVGAYFDGVNVNSYITNPDIIELQNGVGQFQEDDVIGIYGKETNLFYPIAVVAYAYQYPNSSNVRLYVTSNFHTNFNGMTTGELKTGIVSNAKFDANGNYLSNTAYAQIINSNIITTKNNGQIVGVGGSFTDANNQTISGIYSTSAVGYGSFAQTYGVWNTQNRASGQIFDVTFPLTITSNGTYYFAGSGDEEIEMYLNGGVYSNINLFGTTQGNDQSGTIFSTSKVLAPGNYTVRVLNTLGDSDAWVAAAISNAPWTITSPKFGGSAITTGNIIWSTRTPWQVTLPLGLSGVSQSFSLPGGGVYYENVTKIALHPLSDSSSNTVYINSQINISSNYIALPNTNNVLTKGGISNTTPGILTTYNFNCTITGYDSTTRIATISPAISVSIGQNSKYGNIDSTYSIIGNQTNYVLSQTHGGISGLATNETGTFCGIFNVPQGVFKSGSKVFRLDNRSIPNDPSTSSTFAEATFYVSSLSDVNNDANDFSPSVVSDAQVILATATAPDVIANPSTLTNLLDPIAQTFSIDKNSYPNGVFLSSMSLYFSSKATTTQSPVNLSIVGTANGVPNGKTLDNSIVSLTPDRVNTSTTPSVSNDSSATTFTFPAPIYIQSGVTYSIILQSQSTEYNVYLASQNDIAITSSVGTTSTASTKITTVPYTGSLFETQNSIQWIGDATKSLMFVVNRCLFDTTRNPKIPFIVTSNSPTHKFVSQDIQGYYGSSLVNNSKGIINNSDNEMDAINVTTTDYIPTNTKIAYTYQAVLQSTGLFDTEKSIVPGRLGAPNYVNENLGDGQGPRVLQANNSNAFILYANMSTSDNTTTPIISDDGTSLFNVQWITNNLPLSNNQITLNYGGLNYNANTTFVQVTDPDVAGGVKATAAATVVNGQITNVYITNPGSGYLNTPVINIVDANTIPGTGASVTTSSEFTATDGNAATRYITKVITLDNTNTSGDLRFLFTGYRPVGTNIYVFYRIQNTNDSQQISKGQWQLMTFVNNTNKYSQNINDLIDFQAAPGLNGLPYNSVAYTSSTTGLTYTTFNQFQFKIVITTNDNTKVPFLTNLSAIALTSGN